MLTVTSDSYKFTNERKETLNPQEKVNPFDVINQIQP
jgi:hypothetical protein